MPFGQGLVFRDVDRLAGYAGVQRPHGSPVDERNLPAGTRQRSIRPHDERQGPFSGRAEYCEVESSINGARSTNDWPVPALQPGKLELHVQPVLKGLAYNPLMG